MTSGRRSILWFADHPPSPPTEDACSERGLLLGVAQVSTKPYSWAAACGAVFLLPPGGDGALLSKKWETEIREAIQHGVKVIVLADLEHVPSVERYNKTLPRRFELWTREREKDVAEEIVRHHCGPAWSGTVAIEGESTLCDEDQLLLHRVFGDCISVKLIRQPGGRSAKVFCAYARLRDSRVGPFPLPFFVKLDKNRKIERELRNYRECTTLFIPFNQRPNLDLNRCAIGFERGVIVGNFIEESVPLREVVEKGTARQAINSLFTGALRGWRSQAHHDAANTICAPLVKSLEGCLPSQYPLFRRRQLALCAKSAESLGAQTTPDNLDELLRELPPIRHRRALMHGDLHGDNVHVYGSEAILIDFTSVTIGPLVADPAALDVSLVMSAKVISETGWGSFAQKCYSLEHLRGLPPPGDPTRATAALSNSIRLIRQVGLADQLSDFEYATAIAIYLLRHASYPGENREDNFRRQMAYFLAEHLLTGVSRHMLADSATSVAQKAAS